MTTLTARQTDRLAHKTEVALAVAIVLGAIEILRRAPKWLLALVGLFVYTVVLIAVAYIWWIVAALSVVIAFKLVRGAVRGWRESA